MHGQNCPHGVNVYNWNHLKLSSESCLTINHTLLIKPTLDRNSHKNKQESTHPPMHLNEKDYKQSDEVTYVWQQTAILSQYTNPEIGWSVSATIHCDKRVVTSGWGHSRLRYSGHTFFYFAWVQDSETACCSVGNIAYVYFLFITIFCSLHKRRIDNEKTRDSQRQVCILHLQPRLN